MKSYPIQSLLILLGITPCTKAHPKNRIVGGTEATPGRYAYQATLFNGSGAQVCGGTLIGSRYILTAAHCANEINRVNIGRHDLADLGETYEDIDIETKIVHPEYDESTLNNDAMIVKLASDSSAQVVTYDTGSSDTSEGIDVTVIGWGTTSSGGADTDVLLEVELDIVSNSICGAQYGSSIITDQMICAARDGKDACGGDDGGPLIIAGSDASSDVQVGIVSFSSGCANPNYSGVYTRVSEVTDFIECVLNGGTDECGGSSVGDDEVDDTDYYYDDFYGGFGDDGDGTNAEPVCCDGDVGGISDDDYFFNDDVGSGYKKKLLKVLRAVINS